MESITFYITPEDIEEHRYSIMGYANSDDEVSASDSEDRIITTLKLNRMEANEEGNLNLNYPIVKIEEYVAEDNISDEQVDENPEAIDENNAVPAPDSKEFVETSSEVSLPTREYHAIIDALEIKQTQPVHYECEFCGKTYTVEYNHRTHLKTHTGNGPRCPICKKVFPKTRNLTLHMRTHTGEKPYACEVCQKGFADKSNLKVHMRVHTREGPYKCDYCNKDFINNSRLCVHRRLHTDERPFQCNYCSRAFATKKQLSSHVKQHFDGNKPFKCTECGRGYTNGTSLQAHINANHRDTV